MAIRLPYTEPPYLSAKRVSRSFPLGVQEGAREVTALGTISVEAYRGELIALTGPSGSGKSTLLQVLSGLDRPSHGRIVVGGYDFGALSETSLAHVRNQLFGFVFQTPHVLRNRTVKENVALPLTYAQPTKRKLHASRVDTLIDYVGLNQFADRSPNTLSGGELQRLVFARALVLDPQIIFADEPTAALDDVNANHLLSLLSEQSNSGRVVVMASHDPFAIAFADREIKLNKVADALV
ncbi:MAG: ABC transporter ATP-binding protein [Pseudomonadota bacterium]